MTAHDLLHYASLRAIQAVQICENLPLHALTALEIQRILALSEKLDVAVEVGTRLLRPKNVLHYLELSAIFRSPFLRIIIDDADFHPSEEEVISIIRELLPKIRQYGVILGLENHDRFPARSLERIIQATDREWVGICLDTSNSLGAGEGIGEIVDVLLPYTVNLHVKDFQVKRVPHKMGFQVSGCALGSGMLDLPYLLQLFKGHPQCKTITLEVWSDPIYQNNPETLGSEVDLAATLAQESAWVEKSIHYLQNCYHKL